MRGTTPLLRARQAVVRTAVGALEGEELVAYLLALGNRLLNTFLRLDDPLLDHGVHKDVVEQPIRSEKEVAHIGTETRKALNVVQFVRQAAQPRLEPRRDVAEPFPSCRA